MTVLRFSILGAALLCGAGLQVASAADLQAQMRLATPSGPGESIGTVTVSQGAQGAVFKTDLKGLPPGPHGFHLHENGSCEASTANGQVVPAGAAGGHLDPAHSGHHEGPEHAGHLGDLPVLTANASGVAAETLAAPRITDLQAIKGHALMIHAGGDNYADAPSPLGGGGARLACGVLE
ncbi:MAG: superoxide dismutase [Cu-Zn] SodC [Janthinobacterium lividum]